MFKRGDLVRVNLKEKKLIDDVFLMNDPVARVIYKDDSTDFLNYVVFILGFSENSIPDSDWETIDEDPFNQFNAGCCDVSESELTLFEGANS